MNLHQYQPLAYRTAKRLPTQAQDLEHCALGMTTESGEYATEVKRVRIYGREMSDDMRKHCVEELGDYAWYLALAATATGTQLGNVDFRSLQDEAPKMDLPGSSQAVMLMTSAATGMWLMAVEADAVCGVSDVLSFGLLGVSKACEDLGVTLEHVLQFNIDKLRDRFPTAYSDELAEARMDKGGLPATLS